MLPMLTTAARVRVELLELLELVELLELLELLAVVRIKRPTLKRSGINWRHKVNRRTRCHSFGQGE